MKIDSVGDVIWNAQFGDSEAKGEFVRAFETTDGGYIACGYQQRSDDESDFV